MRILELREDDMQLTQFLINNAEIYFTFKEDMTEYFRDKSNMKQSIRKILAQIFDNDVYVLGISEEQKSLLTPLCEYLNQNTKLYTLCNNTKN